jgi:hypothetical protein
MTAHDILELIEHDARSFHLRAADALDAFAEILAGFAGQISADDLTTLIAIGSVLYRKADLDKVVTDTGYSWGSRASHPACVMTFPQRDIPRV